MNRIIAIVALVLSAPLCSNAMAQAKPYSEWKTCSDGRWTCNAWCDTNKPGVVSCTGDCTERHRACLKTGTYWWGAERGPLVKE